MKKRLVAGAGVAALGLAAMPIIGVFAETKNTFTDTVVVNVSKSCTFEMNDGATPTPNAIDTADRTFTGSASAGQKITLGGASNTGASSVANVSITCNTDATNNETWSITAKGGQTAGNENKMLAAGSGTAINTGTAETGATSNWMFRVASTGTVTPGYTAWSAIPGATGVKIVEGAVSTSQFSFTPEYQIYIGTAQESDTYTGKVVYTITSQL